MYVSIVGKIGFVGYIAVDGECYRIVINTLPFGIRDVAASPLPVLEAVSTVGTGSECNAGAYSVGATADDMVVTNFGSVPACNLCRDFSNIQ